MCAETVAIWRDSIARDVHMVDGAEVASVPAGCDDELLIDAATCENLILMSHQ